MEKPDLNRVWETYIRIPTEERMSYANLLRKIHDTIRLKIHPMISDLKDDDVINWYCFLLHPSRRKGDTERYFHIRFELRNDIRDKECVNDLLPDYCEKSMTARFMDVESDPENISGIDKSLLKNEEIEEAWRIIGEQSEWIMNMLNVHKEKIEITPRQIGQFLHFYFNITQLLFVCPCCNNIFHGAKLIAFA